MLDRALTFADPQIVALLKTKFIPVAIDQAYQRRQKDAEGEFYRKIASRGPRKPGRGTTQGLYSAGPDGRFLAFSNNRTPERILSMLRKSLADYEPGTVAKIAPGKLDPNYNPQPPLGGFVVRVHSKILGGYEPTSDPYRQAFQQGLGRDNLWVRPDEHRALAKGQAPRSLLVRIARFHLVDNTRGEPPMWNANEVRVAKATLKDGELHGEAHLRTPKGDREFRASLYGRIEIENGKVVRFDVVARGDFRGEGPYTRGAPKGEFPLAIAFRLADGSDAADVIPPQGSRGWVRGYIQ